MFYSICSTFLCKAKINGVDVSGSTIPIIQQSYAESVIHMGMTSGGWGTYISYEVVGSGDDCYVIVKAKNVGEAGAGIVIRYMTGTTTGREAMAKEIHDIPLNDCIPTTPPK